MTMQPGLNPTPHAAPQIVEGLLTQQVGSETLVYDERTHQAFCLNPVAAEVWRRFDAGGTAAQTAVAVSLALDTPVTEEAVLFAMAELREHGLIAPEAASKAAPTRRDLMRQIGAGAIVMLPAVAAVMAPRAAQAYNGCVNCNATPSRPTTATTPAEPRGRWRSGDLGLVPLAPSAESPEDNRKRRQANGEIFIP